MIRYIFLGLAILIGVPVMLLSKTIRTPLGAMLLAANDDGLAGAWFCDQRHRPDHTAFSEVTQQRWLDHAQRELLAYFDGRLRQFTTPRSAVLGTAFQRAVWQQLCELGYGTTTSYGALAAALGRPTAVRAVAAAVGRNPWSIIVPCHRVLGSQGQLTGYAGGLPRKQALLTLEQALPGVTQSG